MDQTFLLLASSGIEPHSLTGYLVLGIFCLGMAMIIAEAYLHMDKFKPAMFMVTGVFVIAAHYYIHDPDKLKEHMDHFQAHSMGEFCPLLIFMAIMWVIVEMMNERNIFGGLNSLLLRLGLRSRGMFWASGFLSAILSPFLNNITTAMIFGKSIQNISKDQRYTHVAFCNIILASNSGVWFIGTATTLMVYLNGKITIGQLFWLIPPALGGWIVSALVLDYFYLRKIGGESIDPECANEPVKRGGIPLAIASFFAILLGVLANVFLKIDISFAMSGTFGCLMLFVWGLKKFHGIHIPWAQQLQKVEWNTLLFFVGIIIGVGCLGACGWLGYIKQLFEQVNPTFCNCVLGVISGILDNVPVEAAALAAQPTMTPSQWALNTMMVGIGGSLTVIGSAAGVMCMSLEKTYTFGAHFRFLPAILANFFASLALWYLQYEVLKLGC